MSQRGLLSRAWSRVRPRDERGEYRLRPWLLNPLLSPWRRGQVVMFHVGRSGSTVLTDLLEQQGVVYWDGEIYEKRVFWDFPYGEVPSDLRVSARELVRPRLKRSGRGIYGFEVKFFHLGLVHQTLPDFLHDLRSLGFGHFVVLRRKNLLRKVVSSLIAHGDQAYHLEGGPRLEVRQVRVDPDRIRIDRDEKPLLAFLEDFTRRFDELDRLLAEDEVLRLTFEDDVAPDPRIGYRRACDYLGVEAREVEPRYTRTNPAPVREQISNVHDVRAALRGSPFEWMLED